MKKYIPTAIVLVALTGCGVSEDKTSTADDMEKTVEQASIQTQEIVDEAVDDSAMDSNDVAVAQDAGVANTNSDVEIRLADTIDEDRGYCFDIAGGKGEQADPANGLQAHTCYDYTGELLVDQTFDAALLDSGQFKISHFDVCMTASADAQGASLGLNDCDETTLQQFTFASNGQITLASDPSLCVTVNSTEKKEGRGATPVHVMRPITLEACDAANSTYQKWEKFSL